MIEVKNLGLQLAQKEIFSGLNFKVQRGEKIGVIGGEGSGKSSLLDIMAGRLIQTEGEVKISGEVLTVAGNISADFSELRMAEMSAIDKLKRTLRGLRDDEIVLLLDEPTKNLDSTGIEWLINFLLERKNLTTVIVSNDRYFLKSTCEKTIQLGKFEVDPMKIICTDRFPRVEPDDFTVPSVLDVRRLWKDRSGETLFKHVNFTIRRGQKVALVGENDLGKSRLIKTLMLAWQDKNSNGGADRGTIKFADNVRLAYMSRVYSSAAARVELENLQKYDVNFLLLDNPTSCLDLPTIEALEKALVDFSGTIIFAEEDRAFINTIANRIIDVAPTGTVDRISTYEEFLANETVRQQLKEKYNLK